MVLRRKSVRRQELQGLAVHTLNLLKVMFLEESWVSESSCYNCILRQLVADIRCAEAVPDTNKLRLAVFVTSGYSVYPLRHYLIGECCVLALPCFIIKARVSGCVMAILAMLPHRVLDTVSQLNSVAPWRR